MNRRTFRIVILPSLITLGAFYWVARELSWSEFVTNLRNAQPSWLLAAFVLTVMSYLVRAYRWQFFFPSNVMPFATAYKVLILGFFMNNVLPARTGELVRAHMGSVVSGERRTLVLATVASERLVDGLVISLLFLVFAFGYGNAQTSHELTFVAGLFGTAALGVIVLLALRERVFVLVDKVSGRFNHSFSNYASERLQVFITGLTPLLSKKAFPNITLWSLLVWLVELAVYISVARAFGVTLSLPLSTLFLVAVNFSSLIPSAPGAIGVIEAIATHVLVSVGIDKELALPMVIAQHVIQYLVVGIPGAFITISWWQQIWRFRGREQESRAA